MVPEGAAQAAGLKKGDYITKINGISIYSPADMVGMVATFRPGDKVSINYVRNGKEYSANLTLRNFTGTTDVVKTSVFEKLGAQFQNLSKKSAEEMGVKGGVVVTKINEKGAFSKTRIEPSYVILKVNGKEVLNVDDFRREIEKAGTGNVKLEGMYPGFEGIFPYPLKLSDE